MDPPPPPRPRHAQGRVEGGEITAHDSAFSRRDPPEVFPKTFTPSKSEGAGNAGCALHPRSRVQNGKRKRTRAYRISGGDPTFPAQWLYGLYRALPGESGFVASVACEYGCQSPGGMIGLRRFDANH